MTKICTDGYLLSSYDNLAFLDFCLGTEAQWLQTAMNGFLAQAVKTIVKDYKAQYVAPETDPPTTEQGIAAYIVVQDYFVSYNQYPTELIKSTRQYAADTNYLPNGLDFTDNELIILNGFFRDLEQMAYDLLENKIARRKIAFIKKYYTLIEILNGNLLSSEKIDDAIVAITNDEDYKNREEIETE